MTNYISNVSAKAALDAIVDQLDGAAGSLRIYSGTAPADADAALSGNTLLAQLALSAPGFGASADANPGAIATASAITQDSSADATGTATFFRLLTNGGTVIYQGTVGTSGANLNLVTTSIVATQPVSVSSLTLMLPESA